MNIKQQGKFQAHPTFINGIPITKVLSFHATTQTVKINLLYHHQKLLMSSKIYFQKVILMALHMIPMQQHHNTKNSTIHYKIGTHRVHVGSPYHQQPYIYYILCQTCMSQIIRDQYTVDN